MIDPDPIASAESVCGGNGGRLMKAAISFLSMLALLLALRCYPSVCQDDSTFELNSEMTNDGSNNVFTVTIKDTEPRPRM